MIETLRLKFGRSPGSEPDTIAVSPVTVFVGPNNSGKSRILTEIEQYCRSGTINAAAALLDEITFSSFSTEAAEQVIDSLQQSLNPGEMLHADHIIIGSRYQRQQVPQASLLEILQAPARKPHIFCQWFLIHSTLMLNGQNRISLMNQQSAGDMQQIPQSSFQSLFRDDAKRREVRRIIYEAFKVYFVLDPTNLGHLRARLSNRAPSNDMEERGIHEEAVTFHAQAMLIDQASDGVKAFSGIITEVIAGDPRVILIDEPEAFLHPALASKLALEVSKAAKTENKRVFVSTHSPAFIMGCIQSGTPINIIRLTYQSTVATARVLPSQEILELMRHPLLRSTGVLSGLFYEFVVVTESDADRAFYQEVNERLLQFKPDWGIPNCLFINAQNKQTVQTIIRPLRQLGIPAAALVDIDVLKEGGANWTNLLGSANVPNALHGGLATMRSNVKTAMEATGRDMKRHGGIGILSDEDREAAEQLLNQLKEYGIFVVPTGELESWLKPLGASNHGPTWLVDVFQRMGEDPASEDYVRPSDNDVWKFVFGIKTWLAEPNRRGIPA